MKKAWFNVGAVVISFSAAYAQVPQRTTAAYDDWTVSCTTTGEANGKSCEAFSIQMIGNPPTPTSQITIKRAAKSEPFKVFIQVPANVWLESGVRFVYDDKEPGLVAAFRWCIPARCLADADLNDAALKKLRARTEPGHVELKDAAQHDISLPVSFKGFAPALDWMEKQ